MFRPFVAVPLDPSWPSRCQALKRVGMTSAMATFALFSVDDLARMVGKAMQQRAGDNKVAAQVAQELHQAGVTLADGASSSCAHCINQYTNDGDVAYNDWLYCYNNEVNSLGPARANENCNNSIYCPEMNNALYDYNNCVQAWCTPEQRSVMTPPMVNPDCLPIDYT